MLPRLGGSNAQPARAQVQKFSRLARLQRNVT